MNWCVLLVSVAQAAVLLRDTDYEDPMELSSVHLYESSSYTFHLESTVDLAKDDYLHVKFPAEFESVTASAGTVTVDSVAYSAPLTVAAPQITLELPLALASGTKFSVLLEDVDNPRVSETTGPFELSTQTPGDIRYSSQNLVFATLAFGSKLPTTGKAAVTIDTLFADFDSTVSETTAYLFEIDITSSLDSGTWFRFKFPTGWSKAEGIDNNCYATTYQGSQTVPEGDFYCYTEGEYVYFRGLAQDLVVSTGNPDFAIVITQVQNPSVQKAASADTIDIDIIDEGTLLILDQLEAATPQIVSGAISSFSASPKQSYAGIVLGNSFSVYFTFTLPHTLVSGSTIELSILNYNYVFNGYFSCFVASGLSTSSGEAVPCAATSSKLTISGFEGTSENAEIVVQGVVSASSGTSAIVSVASKYSGSTIDSGTFTVLSLSSSLSALNSLAVTYPGTGLVYSSGSILVDIDPPVALSPGSIIQVSFEQHFTISSVTCSLTASGGSGTVSVSCEYFEELHMIRVTTATDTIPAGSTSTLDIATVTLPAMESNDEDIHEVCVLAMLDGAVEFSQSGCTQEIVTKSALSANNFIQGDTNTPNVIVPFTVSFEPNDPIDFERCFVKLYLSTQNSGNKLGFDLDLGVDGTPNCVFSGVSSGECAIVEAASLGSYVTLELTELGQLDSLGTTRLMMKSPIDPSTSFTYNMDLGFFQNGLYKIVSSKSGTVATVAAATTAWTSASIVSRTILTINEQTSFEFSLQAPSAVSAGWKMYMIFPVEWDLVETVSSDLDYSSLEVLMNDYYPTYVFTLNSNAIDNAAPTTFTLSNLYNPGAVGLGTSELIKFGLVNLVYGLAAYGDSSNTIDDSTPQEISAYSVAADPSEASHPAATYTISFTLVTALPDQGKIQLTFPSDMGLDDYECSHSLTGYNSEDVTCSETSNQITVSNLAGLSAGASVTINILRVSNPSSLSLSGFEIATMTSANLLLDEVTGITYTLADYFEQGSVSIQSIQIEPSSINADNADGVISFKATHRLPEGSVIEVSLPFDFSKLPATTCSMDFAVTYCSASGHLISAALLEPIPKQSVGTITVSSAFTVPEVAVTDVFTMEISYNGIVLDTTSSGLTFTPDPEAGELIVEEIDFFPRNQGETATYHFLFYGDAAIQSTDQLVIWFPSELDPSLTTSEATLECWAEPPELIGEQLSCEVMDLRKVVVTGHNDLNANFPIDLYISGVANPVAGKLSSFRLGVEDEDGTAFLYRSEAGNLWVRDSPQALRLVHIEPSLSYARVKNNFTFDFEPVSTIPSDTDQGRIWITFPEEFVLKNLGTSGGWEYPCSAYLIEDYVVSTTEWADIECYNFHSNRIEVRGGDEFNPSAGTSLRIIVEELAGPQFSTETQSLSLQTYDGQQMVIIDSTYSLLSYPLSFTLPLQGEDIIVNNGDSITVRRGTCSDELFIETADSTPVRVFLYLTATLTNVPGARLRPDEVLLWELSEPSLGFRLSVPVTTTPGEYNLEWTKTGDDYDSGVIGDEIYAEVGVTRVTVTRTISDISVSSVTEVAENGHSLPIVITLEYPPHNELYVTPSLITDDDGISFEPAYVTFTAGELEKEVQIYASAGASQINHQIEWLVGGEDAAAYEAPDDSYFKIVAREDTAPEISLITVTPSMHSARIRVRVNEESTLYYQIELYGKSTPTAAALVEAYADGEAARINLYGTSITLTFEVDELAAETAYIVFATCADKSNNLAEVYTVAFSTDDDYESVEFVVDFSEFNPVSSPPTEDYLEDTFKIEFAKALAVLPSRLTFQSYSRRRLQAESYSANAVICQLANDKYSEMQSPTAIIEGLSLTELNSYLVNAEITATLISSPFPLSNSRPVWMELGQVWDSSPTSITGSGILLEDGYLHIVVLDSSARAPTAQQVVWGVDSENQGTRAASAYAAAGERAYAEYSDLPSDTAFDVYVAASSAYPGNNKAVTWEAYGYVSVRTELAEDCSDCDLYFVGSASDLVLAGVAVFLIAF